MLPLTDRVTSSSRTLSIAASGKSPRAGSSSRWQVTAGTVFRGRWDRDERPTSIPAGVAVDGSGNLFIADSANNRIRKVSTSGIITTVAGNGANGFSGDGGNATSAQLNSPYGVAVDGSGNMYVADNGNNAVRLLTPTNQSVLISAVVDSANETAVPFRRARSLSSTEEVSDHLNSSRINRATACLALNWPGRRFHSTEFPRR